MSPSRKVADKPSKTGSTKRAPKTSTAATAPRAKSTTKRSPTKTTKTSTGSKADQTPRPEATSTPRRAAEAVGRSASPNPTDTGTRREPTESHGRTDHGEDLWGEDWDDLANEHVGDHDASFFHDDDDVARAAQRRADGIEVFQNAARELILAARNALDLAEELVDDPHTIGSALESVRVIAAEFARGATGAVRNPPARSIDDDDDFQSIHVDGD